MSSAVQQAKPLTSTGIYSIDKAIGLVLDSFRMDIPNETWRFLRLLAITTAEKDIIQKMQEHTKATRQKLAIYDTQRGYADADRYSKSLNKDQYLAGRNEDLYLEIMLLLGAKGYFEMQKVKARYETKTKF